MCIRDRNYTERPASAAAKLCEGKIVILVNGSPDVYKRQGHASTKESEQFQRRLNRYRER